MELEPTTVMFEAINFVVLMLALRALLYRPLRRTIEARRAAIREDLERAAHAKEVAEQLEVEWQRREEDLGELRATARREALDAAERERARTLERAREDADAERARVVKLLEAEREAAVGWVRREVWTRGTELAGRLMMALVEDALHEALWDRLLSVIGEHASDLSDELTGGAREVEVSGARLARPEQIDALRGVVKAAFGEAPRMTVREDSALLAGWTVRIGDRLFDGSLAGDLDAFRDLARELSDEAA